MERMTKTIKRQKNKMLIFLSSMKMSGQTLKFDGAEINKKEFHACKQPIGIHSVGMNRIVISDKFKYINKGTKYFIGYVEDSVIWPLCIVLQQVSGYIKYFENSEKNMSFAIEDVCMLIKYN